MPVHRYGLHSRHNREDLVEVIAKDLRAEMEGREIKYKPPGSGPEIYIEWFEDSNRLHVHVIWSAWKDVPEIQRPAVILDAFDASGREGDRDRISVAMGLTPEEADLLGIEPQEMVPPSKKRGRRA